MVRLFKILPLLAMIACQPSGNSKISSGKHPVSVNLGSYSVAGNSSFFISSAHAAVSDLKLCFKRLRFKTDISDMDQPGIEDNVDLNIGEINIGSAGTGLGMVHLPEDTYYRIELDLEPSCAGKSVNLSNDFGNFSSAENIKIRFDGVFVVDGTETLELDVQDILNAVNAYNGSGSLSDSLESAGGHF